MELRSLSIILMGLLLAGCTHWTLPVTLEQLEDDAKGGNSASQFNLGILYMEGVEVKKNVEEGLSWLTKAADQGDVRAIFNMGMAYYEGTVVEQNLPKAREWFTKAVALGNDKSTYNLAVMKYRGEGGAQDLEGALVLFEEAAKKGMSEGAVNLAVMLAKGEGISEPNAFDAAAWFTIAKEAGDKKAAAILESALQKLSQKEKIALSARVKQLRALIARSSSASSNQSSK